MSRNIILCFDGTSNQFGDHNTNIVKIYSKLVQDPDIQLAFYDPGIGTLGPSGMAKIMADGYKVLAQATGWGISQNIKDGYRYLMATYQPGDKVFIYGFSRGAFTARSLAGMINKVGLLHKGLINQVDYAYKMYSDSRNNPLAEKFKATYSRDCGVELIGVFDTVGALVGEKLGVTLGVILSSIAFYFLIGLIGDWTQAEIPQWWAAPSGLVFALALKNPIGRFFERKILGSHHFHDQNLSPKIKYAFHALAIDETRVRFRPTRWNMKSIGPNQTVRQTWFAGVHVDVGGYFRDNAGVSDVALDWMLTNSSQAGLKLTPDSSADIHPSSSQKLSRNSWLWWFLRLIPRDVNRDDEIHPSVFERIKNSSYAPVNLPKSRIT